MKTFSAKSHEVKRDWFVVDATDLVLGRLASAVATVYAANIKPFIRLTLILVIILS